jgi:hypothetical protein
MLAILPSIAGHLKKILLISSVILKDFPSTEVCRHEAAACGACRLLRHSAQDAAVSCESLWVAGKGTAPTAI